MTLKKYVFILTILLPVHGFSQKDSTNWTYRINPCKLSLGYIYQGEHVIESGLKLEYINKVKPSKNYGENLSILIGGQLNSIKKVTYLNPFATIRYLKPINENLGIKASISFNHRKINSTISQSLTPEIGFRLNSNSTISYGYNFFIAKKHEWVTNSRIALRLMLF